MESGLSPRRNLWLPKASPSSVLSATRSAVTLPLSRGNGRDIGGVEGEARFNVTSLGTGTQCELKLVFDVPAIGPNKISVDVRVAFQRLSVCAAPWMVACRCRHHWRWPT